MSFFSTPENGRSRLKYVPWTALIALLFIMVGMIVWASGANTALSSTDAALLALTVEVEGYIETVHSATIGAVVVCCIMSVVMVLMSGGRTCLEKAVDQRGRAVCGSWLWLAVNAVLCAIWWIVLFWLVFIIFGSCLWYGAAYTVRGVLRTSIRNAVQVANSTLPPSPSPPPMPPTMPTPAGANITSMPVPSLAPPPSVYMCQYGCLDLTMFDFLVQKPLCVCDANKLQSALNSTNKAYKALGSVVAGSFLLWVGASFLLMNAVADFAKTKRERELLLRAQRAAMDGAAAQLALQAAGGNPLYAPGYQADNLPLLKAQAMQQQQLQMQMQMMAQAQRAPGVAPAPMAPPTLASGHGSQANMGSAV